MPLQLHGLVAATHTPFHTDGSLNLDAVETQAEHLIKNQVTAAFIGGTTGECHSLSVDERLRLAGRWCEAARGTGLKVVVHVGSNCLVDSRTLAAQAQGLEADALAAFSPSYFKPANVDALAACAAEIASAAPALPFYFYDIPSMTDVRLPMPRFLEAASSRIPNLNGIKFTNPDLMAFQQCLRSQGGGFDVLWGSDEYLLAAVALGGRGAVGSTYNFAAPIYHRVLSGFAEGDLDRARDEQYRSVELVALLAGYGFMPAAKAVMGMLGVPVGPARLPHAKLSDEQTRSLRGDLERLGFFERVAA